MVVGALGGQSLGWDTEGGILQGVGGQGRGGKRGEREGVTEGETPPEHRPSSRPCFHHPKGKGVPCPPA